MALIPCKECGHQMSDAAPACPKCGAPKPKEMSMLGRLVLALFIVFVGTAVYNSVSTPDPAPAAAAPVDPERAAALERARQDAERSRQIERQRVAMVRGASAAIKASMRDPDSLVIELAGVAPDDVVCITYRARNGFGGMNRETVAYIGDDWVRTAATVKARCTGLTDYTAQAQ
jgi:hypothetical protein